MTYLTPNHTLCNGYRFAGLVAFASLLLINLPSAAAIFFEDFEDISDAVLSEPQFNGVSSGDYIGQNSFVNENKGYTGFDGDYFAAQDIDGTGANPGVTSPYTVTWNNIDISGASSLSFSGLFAELPGESNGPDPSGVNLDMIEVLVRIDSDVAAFVPILRFQSDSFNGTFEQDTDLDGKTDDEDSTLLTQAAQLFIVPIVGTGSTLDLQLRVTGFEAGGEDFGADSFSIIPEPGSAALLLAGIGLLTSRTRRSHR